MREKERERESGRERESADMLSTKIAIILSAVDSTDMLSTVDCTDLLSTVDSTDVLSTVDKMFINHAESHALCKLALICK